VVKRPVRRPAPDLPTGELVLDPPPQIPPPGGRRFGQMLMMLPMLGGSAGMALMYAGGRGGPLTYLAGGMFGLSGVGMLAMGAFTNSGQPSKQEMANHRRAYLRHLSVQARCSAGSGRTSCRPAAACWSPARAAAGSSSSAGSRRTCRARRRAGRPPPAITSPSAYPPTCGSSAGPRLATMSGSQTQLGSPVS
jgi:hypothetical protein